MSNSSPLHLHHFCCTLNIICIINHSCCSLSVAAAPTVPTAVTDLHPEPGTTSLTHTHKHTTLILSLSISLSHTHTLTRSLTHSLTHTQTLSRSRSFSLTLTLKHAHTHLANLEGDDLKKDQTVLRPMERDGMRSEVNMCGARQVH
jgi:hypothetical protein